MVRTASHSCFSNNEGMDFSLSSESSKSAIKDSGETVAWAAPVLKSMPAIVAAVLKRTWRRDVSFGKREASMLFGEVADSNIADIGTDDVGLTLNDG
jgi:hypothetical protein